MLLDLFISAFATFFVVIDPPGCAPIFASLTAGASAQHRRSMAVRSVVVAGTILLAFAIFGEAFLRALGVSLDAFRIAGGIMLFLIALEMVFEKRQERRESRAEDIKAQPAHDDISIFPMGIPMIAGPGSIASAMLLTSRAQGVEQDLIVLAAIGMVLVLTLAALMLAGPLMRVVGQRMEAMITRLLGVILAALAVQFVLDGVRATFT